MIKATIFTVLAVAVSIGCHTKPDPQGPTNAAQRTLTTPQADQERAMEVDTGELAETTHVTSAHSEEKQTTPNPPPPPK